MRCITQLRIIAVVAITIGAVYSSSGNSAMAGSVDVVIDSNDIQLKSGDDGKQIGKVTLANISDSLVNLQAAIPGDPGCVITLDPTSVQPGRRTEVTLTLGAACDVRTGADVTLELGPGVTPSHYVLKVTPAPAGTHWDILIWAFVVGLVSSAAVVAATAVRMVRHNPRFEWGTRLEYLGTDWSFKDNWVGNVTIGSAALVALLASSDVLAAILGSKPEAALGLLVVAAAVAAALVAIGPLLVKVIGDDLSTPTIGGTLLAAFVTLVGTIGQIAAVTWQGAELTSTGIRAGVVALGFAIGSVVLWYAVESLWDCAVSGTKKPSQEPSETLRAAQVVAAAIREGPALGGPPTGEGAEEEKLVLVSQSRRNSLL